MTTARIRTGLHVNLGQFALLVLVNALVGAMVGLKRSIRPAVAEREFQLTARAVILSFIAVFGITKALTNHFAGLLVDHFDRKSILPGDQRGAPQGTVEPLREIRCDHGFQRCRHA